MERLHSLLESVQEDLLTLYEKDSDSLDDQIRQWELIRRENAILYAARRQGITRLGMQMVPTLASSETKARHAIEMHMYLLSLKRSPFGDEPWTLQQTTRERFLTAPEYCFKKGGVDVDVVFDNEKANSVRYTAWQDIYYQGAEDEWHKVLGRIEHKGLVYTQIDGLQVYYVDFASEAAIYSQTGTWQVYSNNKPILPDTSATRSSAPRKSPARTSRSPTATREKGTPSPRLGRRRGQQHRGRQRRSESLRAPSAQEVGQSHQTPSGRASGRLGRLLEEARDPPALLLKGPPNILKCFRYKCKQQYSDLFLYCSTTFQWTSSEGPKRLGTSRVLLVYTSVSQRDKFMSRVRIPTSIESVVLNMDAI